MGAGRYDFVGYISAGKMQILVDSILEKVDKEGHGVIWWKE